MTQMQEKMIIAFSKDRVSLMSNVFLKRFLYNNSSNFLCKKRLGDKVNFSLIKNIIKGVSEYGI